MSLQDIPLFSALTQRMKWLTARQKVLTQNIANADTPKYQAQDLKPQNFKDMIKEPQAVKMAMAQTSDNHIRGTEYRADHQPKTARDAYEVSPTGNAVVLEEQVTKLAETQLQYQMTTSLYKKHVGMLKAALGRQ